jgi:DNA-binding beta-propeller fold protein YncE
MKANADHKNRARPFHLLLILALLAVLALGVTPPLGTAAPQESKMYVANHWGDTISRADLDGTGGESLGDLNGTLNGPIGIALDLAAGKMYVTNYGNSTISRADLDGNNGVSLGSLNGTLSIPVGIALDLAAGKMYVANAPSSTISRADLDGNNGVSLGNLNGTLNNPMFIALAPAPVTPLPVGGYAVEVSRVKLLAPWLALAAVTLAMVAAAALRRRRSA